MPQKYITYNTAYSHKEITDTVARIEEATTGIHKDLLIVSSMVLILCLSDPSIIEDSTRFRRAIDNLSHQICFIVSDTGAIDPKDMN